jgi:hypothetical protein
MLNVCGIQKLREKKMLRKEVKRNWKKCEEEMEVES